MSNELTREDEINTRRAVLESEIAERRQEYKALARDLDEITAKKSAVKKVLAMSPAERKALGIPEPQAVRDAGAIESGESVQGLAP